MKLRPKSISLGYVCTLILTVALLGCQGMQRPSSTAPPASTPAVEQEQAPSFPEEESAFREMIVSGQKIYRFETFGDEAFWGGTLRLHEAIAGAAGGGTGAGLSPNAALSVGLKVDAEAIPADMAESIKGGRVNLDDPATTLALLQIDAVVGVKGFFDPDRRLAGVGITCALCHSTVDDSFAPGIGARLDGWPNRDLDVGAIVSLAPNLQPVADLLGVDVATVKTVLGSWGPGRYDAELNQDGKAFRPDGKTGATLLPAAFGLAGVNLHTYAGWGSIPYWNAYVAVTQMHGQGTFFDPRMNDAGKFPIAARSGGWNVRNEPDLVSDKLPALHVYQVSIPAPRPPAGSFEEARARRGEELFNTRARCASCHVPPAFTEPGWSMHTAAEIGIDDFQALRSPDGMYRTTPLKGLFTRQKGGFYHDGRFADLMAVVEHYDALFSLGLSDGEKADLVEYLKSL